MQPQPPQVARLNPQSRGFIQDHLCHHRHHFLEDLAPFLHEQLVRSAFGFGRRPVQKAEIVADVVGKHRLELGAEDVPMRRRSNRRILDQHSGGDIAKDEMAIAVAPVEVARGDFGADHQHAFGVARTDIIGGGLNAEGGRGTGNIHVEPEPVDPQRLLNLDRHRGVGALHIRRCAQHRVHILRVAPGPFQRSPRRCDADFGHDRDFVIAALIPARGHHVRIEDRRLAHHMARFDPARLLDEFDRGIGQRFHLASSNRSRVGGIAAIGKSVETCHQFFVGDRLCGREQAGGRNDRAASECGG